LRGGGGRGGVEVEHGPTAAGPHRGTRSSGSMSLLPSWQGSNIIRLFSLSVSLSFHEMAQWKTRTTEHYQTPCLGDAARSGVPQRTKRHRGGEHSLKTRFGCMSALPINAPTPSLRGGFTLDFCARKGKRLVYRKALWVNARGKARAMNGAPRALGGPQS